MFIIFVSSNGGLPYPHSYVTKELLIEYLDNSKFKESYSVSERIELVRLRVCLERSLPPMLQLDAKASFLQMLALILGARDLLTICNLQNNEVAQDPYMTIVDGKYPASMRRIIKRIFIKTTYGASINGQVYKERKIDNSIERKSYAYFEGLVKGICKCLVDPIWENGLSVPYIISIIKDYAKRNKKLVWG